MTDQSIEDASRREFEVWAKKEFKKFNWMNFFINKGEYTEPYIEQAWRGWQAARQSSQSEPVAYMATYKDNKRLGFSQPINVDYRYWTLHPLYAAPQQVIPSEQNMKRAIYENLMIAISHAKVAEDSFSFLTNQIEAMFNTEFSIRKRAASPTAPIERDK
jgi:hypothetical protein